MYKFYWYPKCSTCRKAKVFLDGEKAEYETVDSTVTPPSSEEFKAWFKQHEMKKFFNTSGMQYRELELKDKLPSMSEDEAAELLSKNGMLIKRPLLIKDGEVQVIGFKEPEYKNLFE